MSAIIWCFRLRVNGSSSGIVVVLDQTDGQLSALSFDEAMNRFDSMPKIDLRRVFNSPAACPLACRHIARAIEWRYVFSFFLIDAQSDIEVLINKNNKKLSIGILSITATILFIAQFIPIQPARAESVWKEKDYSILTSISAKGGDNVFVTDNRSGRVAVFVCRTNNGARALKPAGGVMLGDIFK